jgi:hypothetical protein
LSLSADAREVAVGTAGGSVLRVRASTFDTALIGEAHAGGVTAVAYGVGNSEQFATCSMDGTVRYVVCF